MSKAKDKGILVDLVKAMAEEYKDGKITWDVYPFARSMENVEKGMADFHMPLLVNPNISADKLPFQFSSEAIFKAHVCSLHEQEQQKINPSNLSNYKIETDLGHDAVFRFQGCWFSQHRVESEESRYGEDRRLVIGYA